MSSDTQAPEPEQIFERTRDEGRRRLERPMHEHASTAAAAGMDVVFGIAAIGFIGGALSEHFGKHGAHFFSAIGFGIAFVFIVMGRSELFTENFLVPIAALGKNGDEEGSSPWKLLELWTISPIFNILGGVLLILVLTSKGVMPGGTSTAIVEAANHFDDFTFEGAFLSAIAAGALITLMTWVVEGMETMGARIAAAWIVGWLLAVGQFDHVIVATLEMIYGIRFGAQIGWGDVVDNFFTAASGNLIGGMLFVTLNRFTQARAGSGGSA